MRANEIECVPGTHRGRPSFRSVVRLIGYSAPLKVLSAPVGSLKRLAMEAEHEAKRARPAKRRVDFHHDIPFTRPPDLVRKGFEALNRQFAKGNQRILEHYQVAYNCLESCLGDPLCDLLLILVLTLASCSVTPTVAPQSHDFSVGNSKDSAQFAAALTTRMLWFLRRDHFPWQENGGPVLPVSEMVKKIEHKGPSNRILRELDWIRVLRGNRDTPRNEEVELQERGQLDMLRRELLALRKDAPAFISRVFRSRDPVWVERCSQIIK